MRTMRTMRTPWTRSGLLALAPIAAILLLAAPGPARADPLTEFLLQQLDPPSSPPVVPDSLPSPADRQPDLRPVPREAMPERAPLTDPLVDAEARHPSTWLALGALGLLASVVTLLFTAARASRRSAAPPVA